MTEIDYNRLFQDKWIELKTSINVSDAMRLNSLISDFGSICNAYKIRYGRLPELSHHEIDTIIDNIETIVDKLTVLKSITIDRA